MEDNLGTFCPICNCVVVCCDFFPPPRVFLSLHANCVGASCFTYRRREKPAGDRMRFVWIIYCYFEDRFSLHGWLFPSSVRREHGQEGAEPTSPGFCFSGASSNSQPVRSLGRGPEVSARSSLLAAEAQALSSGRCLSPAAGPRCPASPAVPEGLGPGPFLQAPKARREVVFPGERAQTPGRRQASRGQRCAAGLESLELTNFTGRDAAFTRGVPHPRLGVHPSPALPSLSAQSDLAAGVLPGGGRQTAGHCVIHVPRSPMCVAVCVTDGAPGACEGRGVNFLLKGPNTCVRSFLYYFEETRGGGGTEAFLSPPRLRDGVRPQPRPPGAGSLQLPYPRPSGRKHTLHLHSNPDTSIHGDLSCVWEGDGTRGRDRAADVGPEEAQDASRSRGPTVVLQPQGHWLFRPPAGFGVGFRMRSGAGSSPSLASPREWAWCEGKTRGHGPSRSPGVLRPRPPPLIANEESDCFY